jgi:hypothetical protein
VGPEKPEATQLKGETEKMKSLQRARHVKNVFKKRPREPDVEGKNRGETKQSRGVFGASKAIGH